MTMSSFFKAFIRRPDSSRDECSAVNESVIGDCVTSETVSFAYGPSLFIESAAAAAKASFLSFPTARMSIENMDVSLHEPRFCQ